MSTTEITPTERNEEIVRSPHKTLFWPSRLLRRIAGPIARRFLPMEVVELPGTKGLSRARQLAKMGYGILMVSTHPTQGEIPREVDVIGEDPVFKNRELGIPETPKHYKWWHGIGGRSAGISVFVVSNEDSVAYFKNVPDKADKKQRAKYERKLALYNRKLKEAGKQYVANHPEAEEKYKKRPKTINQLALADNFLNNAVRILDEGGIDLIYVQGGRRPFLETITQALTHIMERANVKGVHRYAITTVGVAIFDKNGKEIEDYGAPTVIGYNPELKYVFTVGKTDTATEFQKEAEELNLSWDQLILLKLKAVSSSNYLPKQDLQS